MIRLPLAAITSARMGSLMGVAIAASAQTAAAPDAARIHVADQAFQARPKSAATLPLADNQGCLHTADRMRSFRR